MKKGRDIIAALRPSHPISSVILILTTLLIGDVWGQQPNKPTPPPPAPLVPAEQAWLRSLPASPAAAGVMDARRVYVPLQEGGTLALDRETGETAWTNPLGAPWPLVLAPSLVVAINTGEVAAFNRDSGETRWRVELPSNSLAPAVTVGNLLLLALENGSIVALRTEDGASVWTCRIGDWMLPVFLAADERAVYATTGDSLVVGVDLSTGALKWRRSLAGTLSPPALGKDRVFVGSTRNAFFALDASTGRELWRWDAELIGGDVIGAAVDGDVTYFVGLDNLLHAVNRGNGNQRWKQPTPMRPIAAPMAFGGVVAVFGISPVVATFNAKTGAAIGTYALPAESGASSKPTVLVDPDLQPFRVSMVVITADGRAIGLRPSGMMFREAPAGPLTELPGRQLQRERLPITPTTR